MSNNNLLALALALGAITLTGCGSDNNNATPTPTPTATQTVNGMAATGKAMAGGTVEITNANGKKASSTIKADGSYTVTVEKAQPYLLKASTAASAGVESKTEYSYANDSSVSNVNVTQLTTQALFDASGMKDLAEVYKNWATSKPIDDAKVLESAKEVVANLKTQLIAKGYTEAQVNQLNVLNQKFVAQSATTTGDKLDQVLDQFKTSYTCTATACSGSYQFAGTTVNWNSNIATTGINISFNGSGPAGSGKACVMSMTVMGVGNQVCLQNFPENAACDAANDIVRAQAAVYASGGATVSYSSAATCPAGSTIVNYQP